MPTHTPSLITSFEEAAMASTSTAVSRTESVVVSAGPDFENDSIRERETFGWNLHNRQEIIGHLRIAETPDDLGRAIWRGVQEGASGRKTLEYDHYVKLHFTRPLSLPNLARIRELEAEYFRLPYPPNPASQIWPVLFTLMPIPGGLMMLSDPTGKNGPGLAGLIVVVGWMLLGIKWITSRQKKRKTAEATRASSERRADEICKEATSLLEA
jgi:hypothetical protein